MRHGIVASTVVAALAFCACGGNGDADKTKTAGAGGTTAVASPSRAAGQTPTAGASTTTPAAISIDAPAPGSTVKVPISVSGQADVFEGVLQVQLLATDGTVLCERKVQATSGTGTPGTWETTMAVPPPNAPEDAVIRAFSRSARDGSDENVVTEPVHATTDVPAVVILTPTCNADVAVGVPLKVTGTASVFEAALSLELRDPDGRVVSTQSVTADAAGPARGNWSATIDISALAAGNYELTAFDLSARDGSRENEFTIQLRLTV